MNYQELKLLNTEISNRIVISKILKNGRLSENAKDVTIPALNAVASYLSRDLHSDLNAINGSESDTLCWIEYPKQDFVLMGMTSDVFKTVIDGVDEDLKDRYLLRNSKETEIE